MTATANAAYTSSLRIYTRNQIGTSVNIDNPSVNGFFEIRGGGEVSYTGILPFTNYGGILNLKCGGNITMMQIAGGNGVGFFIRGKQGPNVTLSGVAWHHIMTGTMSVSGSTLTINIT